MEFSSAQPLNGGFFVLLHLQQTVGKKDYGNGMEKFIIEGGARLQGRIRISGAKNASLALMPATLLAPGIYKLYNTPDLRDVRTMAQLLEELGVRCHLQEDHTCIIDSRTVTRLEAPYEQVKKMRASFYVLGPLLARYGEARVSLPGGCAWGPRPVDLHLKGMEKLGAAIRLERGYVVARATKLRGTHIHLDVPSVGATGNILMAAVLAEGTTTITNAAVEPEIQALAQMLVAMGAHIDGIGTSTLHIEGVAELHPTNATTIPDRIEAGTFLIAGAMTRGDVELLDIDPALLTAVLAKLEEAGCHLEIGDRSIRIQMEEAPTPTDVVTAPYPGFPTDMQAQWTAFMTLAPGTSRITDTIFHDRFKHVPELVRLGADIQVVDNTAIVNGGKPLMGAKVMSTDLRASAALILAALVAENTSEILRIYHIDRGYERIEQKLQALGAKIQRVPTDEF